MTEWLRWWPQADQTKLGLALGRGSVNTDHGTIASASHPLLHSAWVRIPLVAPYFLATTGTALRTATGPRLIDVSVVGAMIIDYPEGKKTLSLVKRLRALLLNSAMSARGQKEMTVPERFELSRAKHINFQHKPLCRRSAPKPRLRATASKVAG